MSVHTHPHRRPLAACQIAPATFRAENPGDARAARRISRQHMGRVRDALTAAAEAFEQMAAHAGRDNSLPSSKRSPIGSKPARTKSSAGESRDRLADLAATGRQRVAADDQPASPGGRGRPRRRRGRCRRSIPSSNIRSLYGPLGPVIVFGPNNFPLAFNSAPAAILPRPLRPATRSSPKPTRSHPGTTRLLAEEAHAAAEEIGMPPAMVQLIYRTSHEDGERLVSDLRVGATGYTGSRAAGLKLKAAADNAGKPIYLELSSVNPVVHSCRRLWKSGSTTSPASSPPAA